jgi:hypothetical protein
MRILKVKCQKKFIGKVQEKIQKFVMIYFYIQDYLLPKLCFRVYL